MTTPRLREMSMYEMNEIRLYNNPWVKTLFYCCAVSSITCLYFKGSVFSQYLVFISDFGVTCLYTIEMIDKMNRRGINTGESPYLTNSKSVLDYLIVISLWTTIIIQILEMVNILTKLQYLLLIREPRAFIIIIYKYLFQKFLKLKIRSFNEHTE